MNLPWNIPGTWKNITERASIEIKTLTDIDNLFVGLSQPKISARQVYNALVHYLQDAKPYFTESDIIKKIFPTVCELLLSAQETFNHTEIIPITPAYKTVSFTRLQVATLIAGMWLGLFSYNYFKNRKGDIIADIALYPEPNFRHMWTSKNKFAMDCMFNYFMTVRALKDEYQFQTQRVIYRVGEFTGSTPITQCKNGFRNISCGTGDSDDAYAKLRICSASNTICAKAFKMHPTQEEIVMLTRPECLLMLLVSPNPQVPQMCNVVIGAEKISDISGVGTTVQFRRPYTENLPLVDFGDYSAYQTANAFAVPCEMTDTKSLFTTNFDEDLVVLITAMGSARLAPGSHVAIGRWCYEFSANPGYLRLIQALIAASYCDLSLDFYTNDTELSDQLDDFMLWLADKTCADLYQIYKTAITEEVRRSGSHIMGSNLIKMLIEY